VFFFSWIDLQYSNLMVLISELPILGEF
jgi:hypothetical protein